MAPSKADADSVEETESLLSRPGISPLHDTSGAPTSSAVPTSVTSPAASMTAPPQSPSRQPHQQQQAHQHQQQSAGTGVQSAGSGKPPAFVIPANAERRPLLQAASATLGSPRASAAASDCGSSGKEVALCRICFEEDQVSSLEEPCACSGTQRFAHHACIQRWVEEKGHTKCEVCEQPYRGEFTVPPPAPLPLPVAGNVDLIVVDDDLLHHGGGHLDLLDEGDQYYQRNPGLSWCFSFVIFIMFLVVIHHTMVVSDGIDGDDGGSSGGSDPAPGSGSDGGSDAPSAYAASLTLFLFWVATKAFIIGLPLYTVMKIAARQAQREQYDAMLRAGAYDGGNRRMVLRVRAVRPMHADGTPAMVPMVQLGPNAV